MISKYTANVVGYVRQLRLPPYTEKRIEPVRLISQDESKVIVQVKIAKRDDREFLVDENGKKTKNKMFDKIVYETHESQPVYDAKPEEVWAVIKNALNNAEKNGKR